MQSVWVISSNCDHGDMDSNIDAIYSSLDLAQKSLPEGLTLIGEGDFESEREGKYFTYKITNDINPMIKVTWYYNIREWFLNK